MMYETITEKVRRRLTSRDKCSASCHARILPCLAVMALCALSLSAFAQATWHTEVVDDGSGANVGKSASLVIDGRGNFHIGYYDDTRHMLRYAFRDRGDTQWFKMAIPSTAPAYEYLSLAVDSKGWPHFSFLSESEGMEYAFWDGQTWQKVVIDNIRASYFNSIQLDVQGHPRISYYQEYSGDSRSSRNERRLVLHLKGAFFDGQQWFIQTVDWRGGTGKYNSLAVDLGGNPHIAYVRVSSGELLYAHRKENRWQFSKVDSGASYHHNVGEGNSIALDPSGNPGIAYLDITANTVKYASWDGSKWKVDTVDHLAGRALLQNVSLKVDSQNRAHIAYYDGGTGVLKYATQTGTGWLLDVADREGNVGMSPSLCLDEHDKPYIAYYDVTRHALKFAQMQPASTQSAANANR